jgi:single-strand DNA-binding protein
MNLIIWSGNLTADATSKVTVNGTEVLSFTVAGTVGFGEKKRTEYRRCVFFGKYGPKIAPYLLKGTSICVSGEPTLDSYTKDGVERFYLNINVDKIDFLSKQEKNTQSKPNNSKPKPYKSADVKVDFDDEVPF